MKKRTKVALGVLACCAAAIGGVVAWQWNNVDAVVKATQYTGEELEEKRRENQQKVDQAVSANPGLTVRDLTEEEKAALREGSMTDAEIAEKLLETIAPAPADPPAPQPPAGEETPPPAAEAPTPPPAEETPAEPPPPPEPAQWEKELSALVARVYVLREEYTIALDNMKDSAVTEYRAMKNPTKKALMKFARGYISQAVKLEKECDGKMDAIIEEMEAILSANGGDMTLVETVAETYASEKSLKKAWYMTELEKRGWI